MFAQGGLGDAEAPPELVSTKKKSFYLAGFEQFLSCRSSRGSGKPRVPVEPAEQVRLHSCSADEATDLVSGLR